MKKLLLGCLFLIMTAAFGEAPHIIYTNINDGQHLVRQPAVFTATATVADPQFVVPHIACVVNGPFKPFPDGWEWHMYINNDTTHFYGIKNSAWLYTSKILPAGTVLHQVKIEGLIYGAVPPAYVCVTCYTVPF